jgi:hypothetical protein
VRRYLVLEQHDVEEQQQVVEAEALEERLRVQA